MPGEYVERITVDEAAVIVADIHDNGLARLILGIKIEIELIQRCLRHIKHVHISEPSAASLDHIFPVVLYPVAIKQVFLGGLIHRTNRN